MIPTSFLNLPVHDTSSDREKRQRAEQVRGLFGGPASTNGLGLNFSRNGAPARTSSAGTDLIDFGTMRRSEEEVRREEIARRMDRLPRKVQNLTQSHGINDIELLEVVAAVTRRSDQLSGERVQVFFSDTARALGISAQRAEFLLDQAVSKKLLRETSRSIGSGWYRSAL
jgi:hypothetical protein